MCSGSIYVIHFNIDFKGNFSNIAKQDSDSGSDVPDAFQQNSVGLKILLLQKRSLTREKRVW